MCEKRYLRSTVYDKVLRHIGIIGQKLLRILRQTITAVAEALVIVVAADTRIQADAVDDLLRVQSLHFRIGIQFVKIRHTQGQVCIGKKFHCLCFCKSYNQCVNIFFERPSCSKPAKMCAALTRRPSSISVPTIMRLGYISRTLIMAPNMSIDLITAIAFKLYQQFCFLYFKKLII